MLLKKENMNIAEKESNMFDKRDLSHFKNIGIAQFLSVWNKETRNLWRKKHLVEQLIEHNDFSTLFELANNDYQFSKTQYKKLNQKLNKVLINKSYNDKFGMITLMKKYNIHIDNEKYYHLLVSNVFNETFTPLLRSMNMPESNNTKEIPKEQKEICMEVLTMLEDIDFKKGLHEFIINDIENRPTDFASGMNWARNRDIYYAPSTNLHIFGGMTKAQYTRIIKSGLGNPILINDFISLANNAELDLEILKSLGVNTKSIVEKAQKTLLLKEESLTSEMKEIIDKISIEIQKFQQQKNAPYINEYKVEIHKIIEETLPNVIKKYLSIDEEYRTTLKNIQGKYPSDLLLESLDNISLRVNYINQSMNESKVSALSIDNRKLKNLGHM